MTTMTNGPIMQAVEEAVRDELQAGGSTYPRLAAALHAKSKEVYERQPGDPTAQEASVELEAMALAVERVAQDERNHQQTFIKIHNRLLATLVALEKAQAKVQPGHIGSPHATKPDYLFWGVLGGPQAERIVERFRDAGLSRAYLEGAGNLVDIYVHKDDFQKATDAAQGQKYRVTGFR